MEAFENLDQKIRQINSSEARFLETHQLSASYGSMKYRIENGRKQYIFQGYIQNGEEFTIRKQDRYAPVPEHIHDFIEICYIYSGSCHQVINGKDVFLQKGELCLIDTNVPHSIDGAGTDDIIINILISPLFFQTHLVKNTYARGIITDFILGAISTSAAHNQYVIFHNHDFLPINTTICQILEETYSGRLGYQEMIAHYIEILFVQLMRDFEYETNSTADKQNARILEVMKFLEEYPEPVSLAELADHFGYSPNYLSSLLKSKTGRTYSEIILDKKLHHARILLQNTDMTIAEAASQAGFTNLSYFYKKYKERYAVLPSDRPSGLASSSKACA